MGQIADLIRRGLSPSPSTPAAASPGPDRPARAEPTFIELGVAPVAGGPLPETGGRNAVEHFLREGSPRLEGSFEAMSAESDRLVADVRVHPFVDAVHRAFAGHRPLVLTPDAIWLLVAQGFARHVNAHAEALRRKLVSHEGSVTLSVRRDDFVRGSPSNAWPEVFDEFSAKIRAHIGARTHGLLVPSFSTTTATSRAAAQIVLMDSVSAYFDLRFETLCGIPRIALEGTVQDWEGLASRASTLEEFDLKWWIRVLMPVLDQFVAAARGCADVGFWRSLYKRQEESGGPYVDGWINAFFPYMGDGGKAGATPRNRILCHRDAGSPGFWQMDGDGLATREGTRAFQAARVSRLPTGLARCDFQWNYLLTEIPMQFVAGFVGVRQCGETLALAPEIGWIVREKR